jgi:hypothetical protein
MNERAQLAALAVEYWKLMASYEKALDFVPDDKSRRYHSQLKYSSIQLQTILKQASLKIISFEGEEFHAGLPASADNLADFDEGEPVIVSRTLEPAVVHEMAVLSKGRVIVEKSPQE